MFSLLLRLSVCYVVLLCHAIRDHCHCKHGRQHVVLFCNSRFAIQISNQLKNTKNVQWLGFHSQTQPRLVCVAIRDHCHCKHWRQHAVLLSNSNSTINVSGRIGFATKFLMDNKSKDIQESWDFIVRLNRDWCAVALAL